MSKKKNTLKDLDEFLKQQAATLVSPARIENIESKDLVPQAEPGESKNPDETVSVESITEALKSLERLKGNAFMADFQNIILNVLEKRSDFSPEEKMLVNTVLYMKHGAAWKEAIKNFWKDRNA